MCFRSINIFSFPNPTILVCFFHLFFFPWDSEYDSTFCVIYCSNQWNSIDQLCKTVSSVLSAHAVQKVYLFLKWEGDTKEGESGHFCSVSLLICFLTGCLYISGTCGEQRSLKFWGWPLFLLPRIYEQMSSTVGRGLRGEVFVLRSFWRTAEKWQSSNWGPVTVCDLLWVINKPELGNLMEVSSCENCW